MTAFGCESWVTRLLPARNGVNSAGKCRILRCERRSAPASSGSGFHGAGERITKLHGQRKDRRRFRIGIRPSRGPTGTFFPHGPSKEASGKILHLPLGVHRYAFGLQALCVLRLAGSPRRAKAPRLRHNAMPRHFSGHFIHRREQIRDVPRHHFEMTANLSIRGNAPRWDCAHRGEHFGADTVEG